MTTDDHTAIRAIIARQFGSLNWNSTTSAAWAAFSADFLPGALLYPSARPARAQTPQAFVNRMKDLEGGTLRSFHEVPIGCDIRVFGNVAMAAAACQTTENGTTVTRGVEMLLLVKTEGRWQIVSQAWDTEGDSKPIPLDLLNWH